MKKFAAIIFLFPVNLLAQAVATPAATPGVINAINAANSGVAVHTGAIIIGLGIVAEVAMRIWPTKNPMSFFTVAAVALTGLATLCASLAGILNNVVASKAATPPANPPAA